MVDSIEIRLNQLTEAIKGLYAKSSMSQGEIYNALMSLSQRYENLTNLSSEKIAGTLINEFRKTMDAKYGQTNQCLRDLENSLKSFLASQQSQNPKTAAEITRLLNDTANIYTKLNSQDLAIQKIFNSIQQQENVFKNSEELSNLSQNFKNFSQGFENITITLNKNFADFLNQLQQNTTKEEITSLAGEINSVSSNVNSIISAISVIDTKYKDLTGLVDTIQQRDGLFNNALQDMRLLLTSVESIKETIKASDSKAEIEAIKSEIKSQIENIKYEIQKIVNTSSSNSEFKTEFYNLSDNISGVQKEMEGLSSTVQNLETGVESVKNLINDEILYKSHQNDNDFQQYMNATKEEIKTLLLGLTSFKKDLTAINEGNIKVLQEPIERALENLQDKNIGITLKELSDGLRDVSFEIQSSIRNIQSSLNDMGTKSSIEILTQISEAIPVIADKLEIFRTHVVSENSANLGNLKTEFYETISTVKENLTSCIEKMQEDTKAINIETIDVLKVDLQRLSDGITDNVESVVDRVQKEFSDFKSDYSDITIKQSDNIEIIKNKVTELEEGFENYSQETLDKVSDIINLNNAGNQDVLNEIKGDILDNISEFDRTNKTNLTQFGLKVDKLLDNIIGSNLEDVSEKKPLRNVLADLDSKIERTNLQQIHNAKELLEEMQSNAQNLTAMISNIEQAKDTDSIISAIGGVSDKLQEVTTSNVSITDEIKKFQEQMEQKLKDSVHKISTLVENAPSGTEKEYKENPEINNLSNKVSEYLSNFEFLKSNISQEMKESLANEFSKIETTIKKISSQDEKNTYSYTLEDVESDIANLRLALEKNAMNNEEIKSVFEKVIELKTLGLENIKSIRDTESQLGFLQGWFKDTVAKIDEMHESLDEIQNHGFEDIKTRLVQSEKSKLSSIEFATRIENILKLLIKNSKTQEEKTQELSKKIELLAQTQAESFNPAQFIDIFYDNMNQTKMLSNRVEIIEDKINSIQNSIEKLLSYVEQ